MYGKVAIQKERLLDRAHRTFINNLLHAAGLGLIAWFLMLPPLVGSQGVATTAPQTQWKIYRLYSSSEKCDRAKERLQPGPTNPDSNLSDQQVLAIEASRCVSSEDLSFRRAQNTSTPKAGPQPPN